MILLREVQERDLDSLERLAQIPGFINLTPDRDALRDKIKKSLKSFRESPALGKFDGKYLFVAEDLSRNRVCGTSMIAAEHGNPESPHFYFEVGSEEKFSETINTGFIHGTLVLKYDTNGPSEIGGLVVDPEVRGENLGRQISFVRFLFLALNRQRFKRRLLAELLPPLNKKGQSPLWEAVGRRFTNMEYVEADQLCQKNKEFIFSLFPTGKIYTTFLPAEARNAIGRVGKDTEPVIHMLKRIGFEYKNQVDPFDGGPHFWADVEDIIPIKKMAQYHYEVSTETQLPAHSLVEGLVTKPEAKPGEFRALAVKAALIARGPGGSKSFVIAQPDEKALKEHLGLSPGDSVAFMPYY